MKNTLILILLLNTIYCFAQKRGTERLEHDTASVRVCSLDTVWIASDSKVLSKDKGLKLVIKHKYKQGILDQLNVNGINKSTLFPEIEYQGRHLIDTYKTS